MEIQVGYNPPVKHKIYWGGELVDLGNATVQVDVYDVTEDPAITPAINPGVKLSTLVAEKSEVDLGTYYLILPMEYVDRQRDLRLVWKYTVNFYPVTKEHKVFVVTPYADLAQAVDYLKIGSDPSDPNYKTFQEICDAEKYARKMIDSYTGQSFNLYDSTHTVYGNGSDVLPLPYKIADLHELYANDILLVDNIANPAVNNWGYDVQISESGFGLRINRATMLDNTVYVANGMIPPSINDFSGGFNKDSAYRVQGRFGWAEVPDDIEIAAMELMRDYFSSDSIWQQKYLKSIQTFDWQFEYSPEVHKGTGNAYVDTILLPYVLTQMVIV
jgi:hypothetical protein